MKVRLRHLVCGISASVLAATAGALRADTVNWTNPAGGLWTDATWTPHAPLNGDNVINPLTGAPLQYSSNAVVASLLSQSNFTIVGGVLNGSQTASASTVQVNATLLLNGGGLNNVTVQPGTGGVFQYSANANNALNNVILNANLTPGATGFVDLFNSNTLNATWTLANTSNGIRFHDGNALLTVGGSGSIRGFGTLFNFFLGGTLANNGTVQANTAGQTLSLNVSNINGSGTFSAINGSTLTIGGVFTGNNAAIAVDAASTVLVDAGGLSGSFASGTGSGFTFSANANNFLSNSTINANLTLAGGGFVDVVNGNTVAGTINMAGTANGMRFHDGNAKLTLTGAATMRGYGSAFNFFLGGVLENNGVIRADTAGKTLALNVSNINGSGTFSAVNGGTLVIGGVLTGNNAQIAVDGTPGSAVLVDAGGISGTFVSATGSGFSFSGNANNFMSNAIINSNLTIDGPGFVDVVNNNTVGGTINMSGTANGMRLHDGNARLTLTGTMRGFGTTFNFFAGGTLENNGLISADVGGKTLALTNSNIIGTGTFQAVGGGTLLIGGALNGTNAVVHADTGAVLVHVGAISGSFAASTGAGFSFSGNGNNAMNNAVVNGNLTIAGDGYVRVFNGGNVVSGIINMAGTTNGMQLHDGNALLTITGTMHGFGTVYNFFTGGTMANNGLVSADAAGKTLALNNSFITGSGTFEGKSGGTLAIGGALNGSGASVHGDTGTVLVDGGAVSGTFGSATGTGFSFSGNGGNALTNASINGNMTFAGTGYVRVFNTNTVGGTIGMSGTSNGIQFHDGNALLTLTPAGTMRGYGATYNFFVGGLFTNNGLVSAEVPGQILRLGHSTTNGSGTYQGVGGGTLTIATNLAGNNAVVHGDTGTVLVDAGVISGTFAAATGTGFSFSGNGNNAMSNASVAGNLTVDGAGYVKMFNNNTVSGTIAMSGITNGIQFQDGNASLVIAPSGNLRGFGTLYNFFVGGQLVNHGQVNADVSGKVLALNNSVIQTDGHITVNTASTLAVGGVFTQTDGETSVDGLMTATSTVNINGGLLTGNGQITGNVRNNAGRVSPGHSPGDLTITGGYQQDAGGVLAIELGGTTPGVTYDRLDTGTSNLAGTLNVSTVNGFVPTVGQTFDVLSYTTRTGTWGILTSDTGLGYHVTYLPTVARITIDAVPVPEPSTVLLLGVPLLLMRRRRGR